MQPIYAVRTADVYQALDSSPNGLTAEQAESHQALYGLNLLSEPPAVPLWRRFAAHMAHPMALLLIGAGSWAVASGRLALGLVIWIVVLANAAFSFWQEYRAEQAITALKQLLPHYARAVRAGAESKISASDIVPGDVLILAEGDHIPADARVVEEYGLRVNNAALTGEAIPARKVADASLREGLTEIERPNLIFAGTSVVSGTGRAVVYAVGMTTQFGRIASLTQAVPEAPSLLQQGIRRITRLISLFAFGLGLIVFIVSRFDIGLPWFEAFFLAFGLIVAAIPEGLLPIVTITLAMAVRRLAQQGVLVKKLAVVETLGTTSVICTDKSGTLTQNQMTVREVWVGGRRLAVSGVGYEPAGELKPSSNGRAHRPELEKLLAAAALCNNARLNPPSPERPQWTCLGDQTEAALLVLALKGGVNDQALSLAYPRIHELPFDARRKRMSTIHRNEGGEVAFLKGAPKEVLRLCTSILQNGQVRPLDEATRADIMAVNDNYARNALRVLALAYRELPPRTNAYTLEGVERELIFLGLVGMADPPRPEVATAVEECRQAGIRIVMITGDYGLTAESVARRVGLLTTPRPQIITGAELEEMSDGELQSLLNEEVIFARMAPEHKLRLVAAFQARGDVVAVSGDGVNDVPALRKADIGVAMGITGTDVAKEAADVVLTNDNFAALASAIAEGRAVYDNLRKFITYILASNVPEVMPFIVTALFPAIPLALTVSQILAIDLGTDVLPALALGLEKPEPKVMNRPPRRRTQPLINSGLVLRALWLGLIETALCYLGFLFIYDLAGQPLLPALSVPDELPIAALLAIPAGVALYPLATTVFHAGVVMAQIGNAFTCRTEVERVHRLGWFSNSFLWAAVAMEIFLIVLLIYLPPLTQLFDHAPLPLRYWGWLILYAPALYALDRIRKSIARRTVGRALVVGTPNYNAPTQEAS
ncbi:MAG: cation-transporting P-type ATPase [Chloroflexi bacterium]|nr:cation-transporting P-type ATPase [Chloroflexota bacterium]